MENLRKDIETIVNNAIEENEWEKLSDKEYEEFLNVTDIAKCITINEKTISSAEVNDVLEELGLCKRNESNIILTDEGKKYGRYVIAIHLSKSKPIITDKGYARYKIEVVDLIKKFISENPNFIVDKRIERKNKALETRKKNKELEGSNKEVTENE